MAKANIWMPFYVADYLADTTRLTTEQHGAYILLILDYWRNGPPPNDPAVLAQITRMPVDAWARCSDRIIAFFEVIDGMLIHGRIDREREVASGNKSKKAVAGTNGAKAKWGDTSAAENRATRSERLAAARRLATHLPAEWQALRDVIGCCAKCANPEDLVKDHIKPIYQGGSDGIENIQPLCRSCNAAKGPEAVDYRPQNWRDLLAKRLGNAWQTPSPSPTPSHSPNGEIKNNVAAAHPDIALERRQKDLDAIEQSLVQDPVEKPRKHYGSDEDMTAARWMFDMVRKVNATAREPNWNGWANDIRLLREIDGRTHHEICELFRWAKGDSFWCANIQSPAKLREKWDTLVEQRARPLAPPRAGGRHSLNAIGEVAQGEADPFDDFRRG